ncbi:MAG: hypothetical protein IIA90_03355 [Chloroflexi bacterium]|nr:hypothetical protein [Chloroflexota bacterium]
MGEFYNGLGIVVGVFIGILAGMVISILVAQIKQWRLERAWLGYFEYEIKLNVLRIDSWLEELQRYRNAVNANNLANYFGYFDLSRFLTVTANNLLNVGLLYKHLTFEEIVVLQAASVEFSLVGENFMNTQIQQNKTSFVQAVVAQNVDFWEQKFAQHKQALNAIATKLGNSR